MSDSIITSAKSEFRWVEQVFKTFNLEFVDDPPCVFRVSKSLRETKPEAYAPQQIGLGPYHHLRPEFYVLQRQKIAAVKRSLNPEQFQNFRNLVLNRLVGIEPIIRTCYNEYADISGTTLALILAIDGLYLLDILTTHDNGELSESEIPQSGGDDGELSESEIPQPWGDDGELSEPSVEIFDSAIPQPGGDNGELSESSVELYESAIPQPRGDLFMLENQIPSVVLNEIRLAIDSINDPLFSCVYFRFCNAHSPLKLTEQKEFIDDTRSPHLLAYMYHLIVNNRGIIEHKANHYIMLQSMDEDLYGIMSFAGHPLYEAGGAPGPSTIYTPYKQLQILQNVKKVCQYLKELGSVVKKTEQTDKNKPAAEEIDIASASDLHRIAKVQFKKSTGGIRDVAFNKEECALYLPEITLKADSEVILRNLVAYEAAIATPESNHELAEYVDLMCGIVDTENDVSLLQDAGIIVSDLDKKEIAEIFNGITKSTGKSNNKSNVDNAIDELKTRFDNRFRVKVYKFLKNFIDKSWKIVTVIVSILILMLLTLQSLCQIFGCSDWFGESAA